MTRARVLWANLSAQSSHARERWLTRLLLIAQNALKREKYWLTRLLASCSQLGERLKEKNMRSKGFWPLAHSSKSVGKRERLAHKASDLDKTVLTTVKHALTVLNTDSACFNSVKHFCRETFKYDTFLSQNVKIQHFLSKKYWFRVMSQKKWLFALWADSTFYATLV